MHSDFNPFDPPKAELDPLLSNEEYHAHPFISRSKLWRLYSEGPAAFHYYETHGVKETDSMRLGSGIGEAILEPDTFETRVTPYDGVRNKKHKAYQEFLAANEGTLILTREQYDRAITLRDMVRGKKELQVLFREGNPEQSMFWVDGDTAEGAKSRPDWLDIKRHRAVDLKSIGNGWGDYAFEKACRTYGIFMQGAMFLEGCRHLQLDVRQVWLLFVKTAGAPKIDLVRLTERQLAMGHDQYRAAINLYAKCRADDVWPAPPLKPRDLVETEYL